MVEYMFERRQRADDHRKILNLCKDDTFDYQTATFRLYHRLIEVFDDHNIYTLNNIDCMDCNRD